MEKHDTNYPKLLGNLIYVHYGNFQSLVMVATITKGNFPIYLKSQSSNFLTMQQALCPPKPNVLLKAARMGRFCASLKVKLRL